MRECLSLRRVKRYQMIDNLTEQGYNRSDLFEMSINDLRKELYNGK